MVTEGPLTGPRGDSRAFGCVTRFDPLATPGRGVSPGAPKSAGSGTARGVLGQSARCSQTGQRGRGPGRTGQPMRVGSCRVVPATPVVPVGRQRTSEVGRRGKGSSSSMARRVSGHACDGSRAMPPDGDIVVPRGCSSPKLARVNDSATRCGPNSANCAARG